MLYASVNIANKKRIEALPRNCTVSIRDTEGVLHTVQVEGSSLFEAAAHAVAAFREQQWAGGALGPAAVLRVEVHAPSVVHEVPRKPSNGGCVRPV
jgi:hypothetical protein